MRRRTRLKSRQILTHMFESIWNVGLNPSKLDLSPTLKMCQISSHEINKKGLALLALYLKFYFSPGWSLIWYRLCLVCSMHCGSEAIKVMPIIKFQAEVYDIIFVFRIRTYYIKHKRLKRRQFWFQFLFNKMFDIQPAFVD